MSQSIKLIVYPVNDIEKATTFYSKFLGVAPYAETPYYVGYRVGELEVGLDPNAQTGPIVYTDVADITASLNDMTGAGAEILQDAKDVGNGMLIAQLQDADGNIVGLRQQS